MEEYLYDPDPRRRRKRAKRYDPDPRRKRKRKTYDPGTLKELRVGKRGGLYFKGPHKKRYDPARGYKDLMDNILVMLGAGVDSYLTTKKADTFGKGFSVPTVAGTSTTMPYTEGLGIAGGIILPLFSKNKYVSYLGKFLTGMGANGIAKITDPPQSKPIEKEKSDIEKLMEKY